MKIATITAHLGFPDGSVVKNPPANAGDAGDVDSIPGTGRSLGGGNGNPLLYSCLENPMGRGAWWATVHGVTKIQARLSKHALPIYSKLGTVLRAIHPNPGSCVTGEENMVRSCEPDLQSSMVSNSGPTCSPCAPWFLGQFLAHHSTER